MKANMFLALAFPALLLLPAKLHATEYEIVIQRAKTPGEATLTVTRVSQGDRSIVLDKVECFEHKDRKVKANTYKKCSKTEMKKAKRDAVWIQGAKGSQGKEDIFIHVGTGVKDSQGCFILKKEHMEKLLKQIEKRDAKNITVTVKDPE